MKFIQFLVTLFISVICFSSSYAETEKNVKLNRQLIEVLEEATKVGMIPWLSSRQPKVLSQIAVRWAGAENHEKANLLFTKATELVNSVKRKNVQPWSFPLHIQQLKEIAQAQYEIGYLGGRDKTLEKINNYIHQIYFSNGAAIPTAQIEKGKSHNIQLELLLGELYLDVGKLEAAHSAVSSLDKHRLRITKQDRDVHYPQWLADVAVLQIKIGNMIEGLKTLESAEISVAEKWKHYAEKDTVFKGDKNGALYRIAVQERNRMVLAVAHAIGTLGDRMIFRNLLKHSMELSTKPTLPPRQKQHMLPGPINLAAEFDELDLAMQAFNTLIKVKPESSFVNGPDSKLLLAYARRKDTEKVDELLASYSISAYDHAMALIELGKLEDALQLIEAPGKPFRNLGYPVAVSWQQYTQAMGKARFKEQGFKKAFSWAKNRLTPDDKANALLGMADFLLKDSALN